MRNDIKICTCGFSLALLATLSACQADTNSTGGTTPMNNSNGTNQRAYVILNAVTFNYTKTAVFDVFLSGKNAGGAGPLSGGGGIMAGVQLPLGEQTLIWRLDGPEGMARNGDTVTAKNKLVIERERIPSDARYVGVHLYPDDTAELSFANGLPMVCQRPQTADASCGKKGAEMASSPGASKEQLQGAVACARDVPNCKPDPKQDCSDVVNLSIFFDGTGNNKDEDSPTQRWSNVARMHDAALVVASDEKAIYAIYITGVGTPFNPQALKPNEVSGRLAGEGDIGGKGMGLSADRRLDFGTDQLNDTLKNVLLSNAQKLNATTKAYAKANQAKGFADLSKALGAHRLIKQINLSIFGFSRGAAMARAFSNAFLKECKTDEQGKLTYQGNPVRIHFMGLFDTVASFGLPAANIDLPWKEKNLVIDKRVQRCVHYVAAHELRFSFPVDLIQKNGTLDENWTESVYPGVHSDVGGGYGPKGVDPDGQALSNNYARIPMRDMMREAVKNGVRIPGYLDVNAINSPLFKMRLEILPETQTAYDAYKATVSQSGSVQSQMQSHMEQLYACYGTYHRSGKSLTVEGRRKLAYLGGNGIAWEAKQFEEVQAMGLNEVVFKFPSAAYAQTVRPEPWRLAAWRKTAGNSTLNFIGNYVHDSKVDFLSNAEPFSYFTSRGVNESSRNVLAPWYDTAVKMVDATIKIMHVAEGIVVEKWFEGKLLARHTYQVGEKFTLDSFHAGQKFTVETYNTGKQVVIETVDAGQTFVVSTYRTASQAVSDTVNMTKERANALADAAQAAAKKAAQKAEDALQEGMKEVFDGWENVKSRLRLGN